MSMQLSQLVTNFSGKTHCNPTETNIPVPRPDAPKVTLPLIFLLLKTFELRSNGTLGHVFRVSYDLIWRGFHFNGACKVAVTWFIERLMGVPPHGANMVDGT